MSSNILLTPLQRSTIFSFSPLSENIVHFEDIRLRLILNHIQSGSKHDSKEKNLIKNS